MADAVTTRILVDTPTQTIVHLTCISDGTGETAVIKADKSTLVFCPGIITAGVRAAPAEAASLDVEAVRWNVQGFTSVRFLWDHTTDDVALALSGGGYDDFVGPGGERGRSIIPTLSDPRSAGGAGDILLTSVGAVSGATYDLTLWLRKSAA
jgi:hypothetical protein